MTSYIKGATLGINDLFPGNKYHIASIWRNVFTDLAPGGLCTLGSQSVNTLCPRNHVVTSTYMLCMHMYAFVVRYPVIMCVHLCYTFSIVAYIRYYSYKTEHSTAVPVSEYAYITDTCMDGYRCTISISGQYIFQTIQPLYVFS